MRAGVYITTNYKADYMSEVIGTKANFSQNDGRWKGLLLGYSKTETMGQYGCLVTSMANVAQAAGIGVNPAEMNDRLKAKALYSGAQGNEVSRADALAIIYPEIKYIENAQWPKSLLAPIDYFNIRNKDNTEIIVKIDYRADVAGQQWHWCRVIGTNQALNDVEIVDSYTGKRIWLSDIAKKGRKEPMQMVWAAWKYQTTKLVK